MSNQLSSSKSTTSQPNLRAGKAVLIGHLLVSVPILIIMFGSFFASATLAPLIRFIFLFVGFLLGWTWWSFMVPRWRRWALRRVVSADKLQKLAVATFLVWPKGSVFERTEFKVDK